MKRPEYRQISQHIYLQGVLGWDASAQIVEDAQVLDLSNVSFDSSTSASDGYYTKVRSAVDEDEERILVMKRFQDEECVFIAFLNNANFDEEYENDATLFVEQRLHGRDADTFRVWLQEFFMQHQTDSFIVCQLLRLFMCLDFELVDSPASIISEVCIHNKSNAVKDVNLSLLGHWCNKKALVILNGVEEPSDAWMRIKYHKLKEVITERCTI